MSVLTTAPQFLYPRLRQFPIDEVAEKIVRAIEKRNWKVPGITVEFDIYGSGEAKYKMVSSIIGENFKLYFCRIQGRLNERWNDIAALHSVCIPKQILEVYSDGSGPTYYLYVGKDWESDKEWFMNSIKVNSKLNKEPRRYLRYCGRTCRQGKKELFADDDLNREYSPRGEEPVRINTEQKFNEFAAWLEEFVLNYILSFQEEDIIQPPTPEEELIPYEGPWSTVYSICDWHDADRIRKGKKDPSKLPPQERHAYIGNGCRLVPLNVHCENRFPKIAYEGFIWCDVKPKQDVTQNSELEYEVVNAMGSLWGGNHIVAINLKYANQVYVVDNSKYEETRQQLFEDIAPRDSLTDEELGNAFAARGATIVPITEYKGEISMCDLRETYNIKDEIKKYKLKYIQMDKRQALEQLLYDRNIGNYVMVKLFKKELFEGIQFPIGKLYEDISTTYKLFCRANNILYIPIPMYHYYQRKDSIVNNITRKSIKHYIRAVFERYYDLKNNYKYVDLYNVYSIVNVVIKMSIWAIKIQDYELFDNEIYDYYCKMEKELKLVNEGDLVTIMTNLEKACFYLLKLDKNYLRNFLENKLNIK